jgi:hypothetical protein
MLTAETKRRLGTCLNILVGKLALPTDQIELITLPLKWIPCGRKLLGKSLNKVVDQSV